MQPKSQKACPPWLQGTKEQSRKPQHQHTGTALNMAPETLVPHGVHGGMHAQLRQRRAERAPQSAQNPTHRSSAQAPANQH